MAGLEERAMVILLGCRWGRVIDLSTLSFVFAECVMESQVVCLLMVAVQYVRVHCRYIMTLIVAYKHQNRLVQDIQFLLDDPNNTPLHPILQMLKSRHLQGNWH